MKLSNNLTSNESVQVPWGLLNYLRLSVVTVSSSSCILITGNPDRSHAKGLV